MDYTNFSKLTRGANQNPWKHMKNMLCAMKLDKQYTTMKA